MNLATALGIVFGQNPFVAGINGVNANVRLTLDV